MSRHKWGNPVRFEYKTERTCVRCDMVKVTHHPPVSFPFTKFYRGLECISTDKTPVCEPVGVEA